MIITLEASSGGAAVASPLLVTTFVAKAENVVETAPSRGAFDTPAEAVQAAELVDTLEGEGAVHPVRADRRGVRPAAGRHARRAAETRDPRKPRAVLTFRVVPDEVMSEDAAGKKVELETLQGQKVTVDGTGSAVTVDGATVVTPDVAASNGVIHVIDAVILPAS